MRSFVPARPRRGHMAILASGLALGVSLGALPVAAQDGPETPIVGLLDAIAEKRFDEMGTFFCPQFAGLADSFDMTATIAAALPAGIDAQQLLDALVFDVEGMATSVADQTATSALVSVDATLTMSIQPEAAEALMIAVLEEFGIAPSEEMVTAAVAEMAGEMTSEVQEISEDVTVTLGEDGTWLICSEFGSDDTAPDSSAAPAGPDPSAARDGGAVRDALDARPAASGEPDPEG